MEYLKKNYGIPAVILISLCLVGLALIGGLIIKEQVWSFGILVLLFLSLILGVLAVIALVAMYREVGRCHARGVPKELEQEYLTNTTVTLRKTQKELELIEKQKEEMKKLKLIYEKMKKAKEELSNAEQEMKKAKDELVLNIGVVEQQNQNEVG